MPTFIDDTVRTESTKAGNIGVLATAGSSTIGIFVTGGPTPGVPGAAGAQAGLFVCSNTLPNDPPTVQCQGSANVGLSASSSTNFGVHAVSTTSAGLFGESTSGAGVLGQSKRNGVVGVTASDTDAGVNGGNTGKGFGVFGGTVDGHGVEGHSTNGIGVVGFSDHGLAGRFIGNVEVTGNLSTPKGTITCFDVGLVGADCAEEFDVAGAEVAEPGSVMSLDEHGTLRRSRHAYDRNVAGVISGAGDYRPGVVLDQQVGCGNRAPLALMGKVYCLADAQYGAIGIGDLLTSSPTPGHAMRVADFGRAFGAVIGKAMRPLAEGRGLLPVLIALR